MPEENMKEKNRLHQYDKIKPFFTDDTDDLRYNFYIDLICEVFYDSKQSIKIKTIDKLKNDDKVKLKMLLNPLSYKPNINNTVDNSDLIIILEKLTEDGTPKMKRYSSSNTLPDLSYFLIEKNNPANWYLHYDYDNGSLYVMNDDPNKSTIATSSDSNIKIHAEWIGFFVNMKINLMKLNNDIKKKKLVLDNIKSTKNPFYQELIKIYVTDIFNNESSTSIINSPAKWNSAQSFTYNLDYNIIPIMMKIVDPIVAVVNNGVEVWASRFNIDINKITNFFKYIGIDNKHFTYNLDKLAFSVFFEEAKDIDVEDDDLGNFFDAEINDRYTRDPKTFKLHDNESNRNVEKSLELLKEIKDTKCYGTGIGIDDDDNEMVDFKCEEFIINCLKGDSNSIDKCKEYMKKPDYFKKASKEVNNMLPFMALKILDAFKVERVSLFDSRVNSVLLKYESLGEWLKRISDMTSDADTIKTIKNNSELNHYIKLLIEKVNSNPAILNQKYTGTKYDQCTYDSEKFKDTYFYNLGLRARNAFRTNFNKSEVLRTVSAVTNSLALLPTKFNFRNGYVSPAGFFPVIPNGASFSMIGGGDTKYNMYKANYDVLKRSFDYLEKHLESRDKSISEGNKRTINKFFEHYRVNEKKLIQILNYIHRYNEIDRMFGVYDNKKILNMSDFKKIVDAYGKQGNKFIKKNDDLPSLFTQLLSAVEGDLTNN